MCGSKSLVYDFLKKSFNLTLFAENEADEKIKKKIYKKSRKVLVPATADFTSRASKSYIPYTC